MHVKKKMEKIMKVAKLLKPLGVSGRVQSDQYESLISNSEETTPRTPTGFLALYVGEDHRRFVVPMSFLSHPLFKMLLEKASEEYGFEQKNGLVVPCSVSIFQEVVSVVECCHGKFDLERLVDEFL